MERVALGVESVVGKFRIQKLAESQFERHSREITGLLFQSGRQLLKPQASIYDILTLIGYCAGDVVNPILHPNAIIEFVYEGESPDPIGWILTWRGHEQSRAHFYLPKEAALFHIEKLIKEPSKSKLALAVLMKENDYSLLQDGFTQQEISSIFPKRVRLKPDRMGNTIIQYHKMFLTKDMLRRARRPRFKIELPDSDHVKESRKISIPLQLKSQLPASERPFNLSVRRVLMDDYPGLQDLQRANSDHSTLKKIDIVYPNYVVSNGDRFIAMGGSVAETPIEIDGEVIDIVVAGNLVVDRLWAKIGLGSSFSNALKQQTFQRKPDCLIIADNRDVTRSIWEEQYGSHAVCTTGWLALERNNTN